ncbi:uncharacterized protein [Typha latifolia]|uniref:uncharacterized protein isoform X1 n=1 Tax=Typha latifolia TaxID=4733 RepID=UPI003C2FC86E
MDLKHQLPFRVGQEAEAKSFCVGFRGAWFRCKIKNICFKKGKLGCSLEYFDFPDEKVRWTNLYQKPPQKPTKSHGVKDMELMIRPSFPPCYHHGQLPDSYPTSDVIAIADDAWRIGYLVDWWYDNCYWSGRVTHLLGDGKVQIELPEPPVGEGRSYSALCKDLRPSLNWSPESGWTVPISNEHGDYRYSARLLHTINHGEEKTDMSADVEPSDIKEEMSSCLYKVSRSCDEVKDPSSMKVKLQCNEASGLCDEVKNLSYTPMEEGKPNCFRRGSTSGDNVEDSPTMLITCESNYRNRKYRQHSFDSIKDKWTREKNSLTSVRRPETIESSILELEELVNKIKWLKGLVQFGLQWSNAMKPSWKFLENHTQT